MKYETVILWLSLWTIILFSAWYCTGPTKTSDSLSQTTTTTTIPMSVIEATHEWIRKREYGWLSSWRVTVESDSDSFCTIYVYYMSEKDIMLDWGADPAEIHIGLNKIYGQEFLVQDIAEQVVKFEAKVRFCR